MGSPSIEELKKAKKKRVSRIDPLTRLQEWLSRSPITSVVALCVLLAILLIVAGGLMAWQKYVVQERQDQLEAFAEQSARLAASNIANYLHRSYDKLAYFTKNSSLNTALTSGDETSLLDVESALKNSFPKAEAIRIYAYDGATLDLDGDPPLGFSELELIRASEKREKVIPEALNIGDGGWRVNIVVPVPEAADKPVVGTIMVTLSIEEVYEHLRAGLDHVGKIALYQTFDNKSRLIGSFGDGELFQAARVAVPRSPWEVEFTASTKLYAETEIDYTFLLLVGAILSLCALVLFILLGLAIGRGIFRKQAALQETHRLMGRAGTISAGVNGAGVKGVGAKGGGTRVDGLFGLSLSAEDEKLLGGDAVHAADDPLDIRDNGGDAVDEAMNAELFPDHIFRCYDIRGIVDTEINNKFALNVGKALGSEALGFGETALIVARDARTHSPLLTENLIRGVLSTGCKVINIGTVPTPLLYYAVEVLEQTSSGVVVTASHNPAEYNGFKVVMDGKTRTETDIKALRARMVKQDFRQGIANEEHVDVVDRYIETIFSDVALAGDITVVIDAGSGVTGRVAPNLFETLGCKVIPLHCDLDGSFPHHGPDPSDAKNLQDVIKKVQETNADLGVAFDGDGDRLAVVTATGQIIWPDRLLMLFAKDILARSPGGDVVFDVKSSRQLNAVVSNSGGRPIMWKTGHAPMRAKVLETGALVGGEFSGHIFIKDRWFGFDDGMYAAARLIEIMSLRDETLDQIFDEFPPLFVTPEIRIPVSESKKFELIDRLLKEADFGEAKLVTLDGLRAEFSYGWGLVRASNTSAALTMRFEAESEEQIHNLKALFTREIRKIDDTIDFRW